MTKGDQKRLLDEVQMFRIRVVTAESKLKVLREQARQARQRRKEAKRVAQRARKQFKRSKAELADLRQTLAKAEVKLFEEGGRALARKTAKIKLVAKQGTPPLKKSKTLAHKPQLALPRQPRAPGHVTRNKSLMAEAKVVSHVPVDFSLLDYTPSTPQFSK